MKKRITFCVCLLVIQILAAQTPPQYKEEILSLKLPNGSLEGSLVKSLKKKKTPIVLIIAGSGPTDRDCNSAVGLKTDAFKMLAHSLAEKGISSLRYDKRHIGKSKVAQKQAEISFGDFVGDAHLWLDTLKTMKKQFSKFYVAGHSEGSLIAILTVQKSKADGLISLCGPAQSIDSMIYEQVGKQVPGWVPQLSSIYEKWKKGEKVDTVPPYLMSLAHPSLQLFLATSMKYTPREEMTKVKIRTLILGGKNDIQVLPKEIQALYAARQQAIFKLFENMTHVLKDSDVKGMAQLSAVYNKPELPLAVGLVDVIADFVLKK